MRGLSARVLLSLLVAPDGFTPCRVLRSPLTLALDRKAIMDNIRMTFRVSQEERDALETEAKAADRRIGEFLRICVGLPAVPPPMKNDADS